jgi:hypothetical protein
MSAFHDVAYTEIVVRFRDSWAGDTRRQRRKGIARVKDSGIGALGKGETAASQREHKYGDQSALHPPFSH